MSKQLKAPEVGTFVLHLPSGTAGRVVKLGAFYDSVQEPVVELSTGDVYLLKSREEASGEAGATWICLPPEHEAAAKEWVRSAFTSLARLELEACVAGVPPEWRAKLLIAVAREVCRPASLVSKGRAAPSDSAHLPEWGSPDLEIR